MEIFIVVKSVLEVIGIFGILVFLALTRTGKVKASDNTIKVDSEKVTARFADDKARTYIPRADYDDEFLEKLMQKK